MRDINTYICLILIFTILPLFLGEKIKATISYVKDIYCKFQKQLFNHWLCNPFLTTTLKTRSLDESIT